MSDRDATPTHILRTSRLSGRAPTRFTLIPDPAMSAEIAADLDLSELRKVRLDGEVSATGGRSWLLRATLGATVVQPCVVTLEPVVTRIDTTIERIYSPQVERSEAPGESEIPEDDRLEPLTETIDLQALITETIALNLPDYPRKEGVDLAQAQFAAPGVAPLTDADVHPFAALASLRKDLGEKN